MVIADGVEEHWIAVCCLTTKMLHQVLLVQWRRLLLVTWRVPPNIARRLQLPDLWSGLPEDLNKLVQEIDPSIRVSHEAGPEPPELLKLPALEVLQRQLSIYVLDR